MSPKVIYFNFYILLIICNIFVSATDFICNNDNDQCLCSNGECEYLCLEQQCIDKYFICPSTSTSCDINCNGYQSCKDAKFYGSPNILNINCNGTNSCDGIQVFCGTPNVIPTEMLHSSYTLSQFDGIMTDCFINVLTSNAMTLSDISCYGSITNCIINAYSNNSISQSQFNWYYHKINILAQKNTENTNFLFILK